VLPRLAYLTLCRSIQLLVQLIRGDAAKELEILVLRHQLRVLRRQRSRPRLEPADRALLAAISRVLPRSRWSCFFGRPETLLLAPTLGGRRLDLVGARKSAVGSELRLR
jgi:putative transposase